jgi:regulator of cell morphogenesis and NO signaling
MTDHQTLGDLVATNPAAARILDGFGLDYCCHGDRTLGEACAAAGVDETVVAAKLDDVEPAGDTSWTALDPPALADHIVETHHRYLDAELPLLDALAEKVLGVHGERHPELGVTRQLVAALRAELEPHLRAEENELFPAIRTGTLTAEAVRAIDVEHDRAGELLARLRTVTDGFTVPDDGCASYRSLYERLAQLELDIHLHIHKENHTLFPAALRAAHA